MASTTRTKERRRLLAALGRGHVSRQGAGRILGDVPRLYIRALRRRYKLAIPLLGEPSKEGEGPAWVWRYMSTTTDRRKIARILADTAAEGIA